ncbi:AAA family ATPase [Vulgatibacter incomptus]|uniref:Chromosome partition protein smc n=1 Tax=Vulgatibacter incomptus TaxID=1391653 RepID=A0A0K1PBZ2_9BACT|nr:AAA family ATPase [Vulgatibacter incomptus]AKU90926.1 Chromosome partition protein smc [Vulgatibacter incomptus]
MSPTTLRRIRIERFRALLDLNIDLPAKGLVILVGPNGLGKTAVFDSIEWALTGKVRRLSHIGKNLDEYLQSASSTIAPRVELVFDREGVGEVVWDRSSSHTRPSDAALNALIAPAAASELRDDPLVMEEYLHATHLLVQDRHARFIAQAEESRWAPLGRFSRARIFSAVDSAFGADTMGALTQMRRAAEKAADDLASMIQNLDHLMRQREEIIEKLRIAGFPSKEEQDADWRGLASLLNIDPSGSREAQSREVRSTLEREDADLSRLESTLETVSNAPAEWQILLTKLEIEGKIKQSSDNRSREVGESLIEANDSHTAAAEKVAERAARMEELQRKLRWHIAALGAISRFDLASHSSRMASSDRVAALSELESCRTLLAEKDAKVLAWKGLKAEFDQATSRVRTGRLLRSEFADALDRQSREESTLAQEVAMLESALLARRQSEGALARSLDGQIKEYGRQQGMLDELRGRCDALRAAVVAIAAAIPENLDLCPVCSQPWRDAPGQLKARALAAAAAVDPTLTELETEVSVATAGVHERTAELEVLRRLIGDLEAQLNRTKAAKLGLEVAVEKARAECVSWYGIDGSDLASRVDAALDELDEDIALMTVALADDPSADRELARVQFDHRSASMAEIQLREQEAMESVREAHAALSAYRDASGAVLDRSALEAQRDAISRELGHVGSELTEVRANLAMLDQRRIERESAMAVAEGDAAKAEVSLLGTLQEIEAARERWRRAGLPDDPSVQSHSIARSALNERRTKLSEAEQKFDRLLEWGVQSSQLSGLAAIEGQLSEQAANDCGDANALRERLAKDQESMRAKFARINQVQKHAAELRTHFEKERESFYDQVLEPLRDTAEKFQRALVSPFQVETAMEVGVLRRKPVIRFDARFAGRPQAFEASGLLSEGQMASVALSHLLAMNATFQWSNWQAVLLDDPVQYNDAVHVAAFADLTRELIAQQDYQVLMSTHDSDLADLFRRKMKRCSIECHVYRFLGQAGNGVNVIRDL